MIWWYHDNIGSLVTIKLNAMEYEKDLQEGMRRMTLSYSSSLYLCLNERKVIKFYLIAFRLWKRQRGPKKIKQFC